MVDFNSLFANKITIAGVAIPAVAIIGLAAFFLIRRKSKKINVRIG